MARCAYCNSLLLFGGVKAGPYTFCNAKCQQGAHYLAISQQIPPNTILEAIQQLPSTFRQIVVLREYQDLSYQEIARILDCPVGTVMSRLARARSKLRTLLCPKRSKGLREGFSEPSSRGRAPDKPK